MSAAPDLSVIDASDLLEISPVIPVVAVQDAAAAIQLARALLRGGIGIIEITLRTPAAIEAISRIAHAVPDMVIGAGTVRCAGQIAEAKASGAKFIVTPGSPPELVDAALESGMPLLPGVSTATEAMTIAARGLKAMKFFPAEPSGGTSFLTALSGPLPDVRFCPTGGISLGNAAEYLALPNVTCVGGSWLAPVEAQREGEWELIEALAAQSVGLRRSQAISRSPS